MNGGYVDIVLPFILKGKKNSQKITLFTVIQLINHESYNVEQSKLLFFIVSLYMIVWQFSASSFYACLFVLRLNGYNTVDKGLITISAKNV